MPFKLFEFLEIFTIGALLIALIQLEKIGPMGKVFIHVFSRHLHVRIWIVLFTSLSADEFQLNSKSAYISKCIDILRLFAEKKSARPI